MRKTTKLFLGFTAGLLLLCGCSAAEEKLGYENADVAKEALASASSVRMRCDLDNVDASGNIYADEKAAAYMKNSGLFDQTWTISISGEEWFHMKIVTDEEINKMTKSATTLNRWHLQHLRPLCHRPLCHHQHQHAGPLREGDTRDRQARPRLRRAPLLHILFHKILHRLGVLRRLWALYVICVAKKGL